MAAGLTLPEAHFDSFAAAFAAAVRAELGDSPPVRELVSDGELVPSCLNIETAELLRTGGPWGKGFPEPLFDGVFDVLDRRLVGEGHLRLRLRPAQAEVGASIEAIGFGLGEAVGEAQGQVRLAYRLDVNDYRGLRAPQLLVEYLKPAS
jgi:single-stranded-DNA-specific exonuclease